MESTYYKLITQIVTMNLITVIPFCFIIIIISFVTLSYPELGIGFRIW